jgi:hypothetical protein
LGFVVMHGRSRASGNREATMTPARLSSRPDSLGDALRLLADALLRERALFASGVAGIGLGLVGLLVAGVHGPIIEPEGVLSKAITFDIALGIYVLTISLFVPLARFSAKGLARWRLWHVGLTCVAYGLENIQIARGLDPRFTMAGSPLDQALGGVFFLVASGLIVLFVMLAARLFSRQSGSDLLFLATRYAFACTILAFGAGLWMSLIGGPSSGAASILPLHAVGFHGLQAVPAVALAAAWAGLADRAARRWIHLAGLAWLGACVTITVQTAVGRPLLEASMLPVVTLLLLLGWGVVFLRAASSWLAAQPSAVAAR